VDSVAQRLGQLGLKQYASVFVDDDIDGEVQPDLTESELERIGVTLGHRKKILDDNRLHGVVIGVQQCRDLKVEALRRLTNGARIIDGISKRGLLVRGIADNQGNAIRLVGRDAGGCDEQEEKNRAQPVHGSRLLESNRV
jgi:hypothetical protein